MPPSPEDVSPTLARAVLPTYLHHVLDASETLADFALERLAGNETARRELETQIETQRETCAAPVSIFKAAPERLTEKPFARRDEPLSPGARAAKRAADDAKLADLERALRAANAEAGEIEVRLRVAEDAAAALRGAPRELRAVSRLLGDVIADLEASDDDDDDDAFPPRAPRSAGSASSGRSGASAGPGSQEAIATAAAILADAERVDPSVPMVTGARVTAVARAAADAADALLSRAQQCLEEEAKLRGLLERAREARRVNADPAAPVRSPSFRGDDVVVSRSRETSFGASPSASPSGRSGPAWSPGGRFLGSAAAARQSDATAKAQARRATQRRSLKDARTQKRVQRNLDYHIARLEGETRRMSTEADALEAHLKRVEANHRRAAGALDTLAWLLEHAEAFRQEAARREAERRRRRERRFAPSGASVKASARARTSVSAFPKDDAVSEASASSRGALGLPMRGGGDADVSRDSRPASSRPASSRPASRSSAIERWQARAHAEASSAAPAPGTGEEHWREKYARRRDEIVSREAETRRGAPPGAAEAAPAEPSSRSFQSTDRRPRRVSPLRRHHDRLMERAEGRRARTPERKSDKKTERGTGAAGAAGATDDEAEQTVPSSLPESLPAPAPVSPPPVSSEPTVPVTNAGHELAVRSASETAESEHVAAIPMMRLEDLPTATPPVNRVLDLEAPRDALPEGEDEGGDGERLGGDGELPRPETSLEAIEAELAELRRLEFEATGAVPREFETPAALPSPSPAASLDSARSAATRSTGDVREPSRDLSVSGETKKKPKPLPVVDLRPKPRAKPREPWGPPPAPPKTKWKRNSLDRDAVAALKKETIKAREEKARAESMNVTRQDAFAPDRDAKAPARGGKQLWALDSVKALAPATEKAKKRSSVFKSAYKSLKRAAGIPSKKDKAAAKAKRKERERERAAAGP
jgi:hypothetical protein